MYSSELFRIFVYVQEECDECEWKPAPRSEAAFLQWGFGLSKVFEYRVSADVCLFLFLFMQVSRYSWSALIWYVHNDLHTVSEQSTLKTPVSHKLLVPSWLNTRLFDGTFTAESLSARASFSSKKLLIIYAACADQTVRLLMFLGVNWLTSAILKEKSVLWKASSFNVDVFRWHASCWPDFISLYEILHFASYSSTWVQIIVTYF